MQLSTVFAVVLSLAGAGAAAAGKARRQGGGEDPDPVGAVGVFDDESCGSAARETFLLEAVGDCVTLEGPAGSVYLSPTHSDGAHFIAGFAGKNCSGILTVTPPSRCSSNLNGGDIQSVSAIVAPDVPGPPKEG